MLHELPYGDPLPPAYLKELGPIGVPIFDVEPLDVFNNLALAPAHCFRTPLCPYVNPSSPLTFFRVLLHQLARDAAILHITSHTVQGTTTN